MKKYLPFIIVVVMLALTVSYHIANAGEKKAFSPSVGGKFDLGQDDRKWKTLWLSGGIGSLGSIQFDLNPNGTCDEGRVYWNADDATLNIGLTGNVCGQVFQEQMTRVKNKTGSTILDGKPVYITGSQGGFATVALADASSGATSDDTIGIVTDDINDNGNGYVTTAGLVRDIDTSGFIAGDELYVGTTAGVITKIAPTTPDHLVHIGHALTIHATEGVILVHVDTGSHLASLHDVLITDIQADDSLLWTGTYWENVPHTFGELYYHNDNGTLDFSTDIALIDVTGLTDGLFNNMILSDTDGSITVIAADTYRASVSASNRSASSGVYNYHIGVNGVEDDKCHANRKIDNASSVGNIGMTCLIALVADDVVTFMVNSISSETIEFESLNFNLERIP